jgi:hypothetical protein
MHLIVFSPSAFPPFALFDFAGVLQDGLIGAGIGAIAAKALVHRMERRSGELSPARIRQVEFAWIGTGAAFVLMLSLGLRVALM